MNPLLFETLEARRLLAFGVTSTSGSLASYVIDNGGDVKFSVLRPGATTSSTVHIGDVTSMKYKGQEMLATYAQTSRYSHYEQGLGSTASVSYVVDNTNGWILVTCDDSAATSGGVIQYYAVRRNDNNVYMASLPTDVNNGPGEGRFIAYLSKSVFTNIEDPSDISGNDGAVEGSDVFHNPDGTTHSKFYNMGRRMIENIYHGASGSAGGNTVGAWMFMGNREHSAGGPFFKDIDFQTTSGATEIYNCVFTGHTQTEAFRQGLQGPYALQFTNGVVPTTPDYSWMEALNLSGWISAAQRGTLSGTTSGVPSGHEVTVGLSNSTAQYWGTPNASGQYTITGIQPGSYTQTLYAGELAVGTRMVTINAGATTAANITDTYYTPTPVWRIGTWDGTPLGFLNSDKIEIMHPSDVRMTPWVNTNFTIGANTDGDWPLVQFKAPNSANNPNNLPSLNPTQRVTFNLTSAQAATAMTLRIGITLAFAGGRPIISVNGGSYTAAPAISTQPDSRGITRGTWRGNNWLYTYNISTSQLRTGSNTIDIGIASGSYDLYSSYLQPSVVYDAIDLVPTSSITNAPQVTTITVSPPSPSVAVNTAQQFTAVARDQFGNVTPANVTWSATRGTIDDTGAYVAPASGGSDTVTATSGTVMGSTNVSVVSGGGISGLVFHDINASGVHDPGEPTFGGVQVYLDANNNELLDSGELSTTTGGAGDYAFASVPAGTYTVREIAPANFVPASAPAVTISNGASFTVDLPNAQIVYAGTAGNDSYLLRRNLSGKYEILTNGSLAYTVFTGAPSFTFNLDGGDDVLSIDFSGVTPIPGGGVSFDGGTGADTIAVVGSAGADTATFSGGTVTISGAPAVISSSNSERGRFDGNGGWDNLTITDGATVELPTTQHLAALSIAAGASAMMPAGAAAVLVTRSLSVSGRLDLADNDLIVDYSDPSASPLGSWNGSAYTGITGLIASGRAGGTWNGNGIVTTASPAIAPSVLTTLAPSEAADLLRITGTQTALWNGEVVDATAVIVKYTYGGDANLDGKIDGDDYFIIDSHITQSGSAFAYRYGDFNFDGAINGDDYFIIDSNIAAQDGLL